MTELLFFLLGATAASLFVLITGWLTTKMGASEPARGSWAFFGLGGVLLVLGLVQRSPAMLGAGAGVLTATSTLVWWSTRRSEHRDQQAKSFANELGLSYEQEPSSPRLRLLASTLTGAGDSNKVRRVLSGLWRGVHVSVFDFYYEVTPVDGPTMQRNFTGALIASSRENEPITITGETFLTKIGAKLGSPDLHFDDDAFDSLYHVRSKDSAAARDVLGPEVRSWLSENGRGMSFLIGRGAVVCMAKEGTASRAELLELVSRFREVVSETPATDRTIGPEIDPTPADGAAAEVEGDQATAGPGQKIAIGLVIAIVAPIALFIGAYVLFYVACATGQGCL